MQFYVKASERRRTHFYHAPLQWRESSAQSARTVQPTPRHTTPMTTEAPTEPAPAAATPAEAHADAPPPPAAAAAGPADAPPAPALAPAAAVTQAEKGVEEVPGPAPAGEMPAGEGGEAGKEGGKPTADAAAVAADPTPSPHSHLKKRKVALFVAYVGAGYYGMQYNKALPTIERALRDAIAAAGGIAPANVCDDFSKIGWSRAARTDRGVSAVGQVVSLRLLLDEVDEDHPADPVPAINAALPPAIRVLGCARVVASFDARKACDRRRYEYLLPAWALDPTAAVARTDAKEKGGTGGEGGGGGGGGGAGAGAGAGADTPATQAGEAEGAAPQPPPPPPAPFVFDEAARARVNAVLRQYEGTHK